MQISGDKLAMKFETTLSGEATEGEETKEEEVGRKALVKIQVLRVNDNKCCVKFNYCDPMSKHDLPKAKDIN